MGIFIFGLLAIVAGAIVCHCHRETIDSAESYSGEVVGIRERIVVRMHSITKQYRPEVKFNLNGKTHFAEHHRYSQVILHDVGETVIVCVNPKMPKYFYYADEEQQHSLPGIIMIACGVFTCALTLIFIAIF